MQIFIQTRGKTQDYAFVGAAPPERWWAKPHYRNATSYEKPTLILESLASGEWRCYISAIPSTTRDRVGTMIRYTLVLSGSEADDKNNLLMLLAYMLDVFATDPVSPANELTALLDAVLAPNIDQWLSEKVLDVQASIEQISKGIATLKPSTNKCGPLIEKIEGWCETSGPTQAVALLNFVGPTKDPVYDELQAAMSNAKENLLLLLKPMRMGSNWTWKSVEGAIPVESARCPSGRNLGAIEKKTAWMLGVGGVIVLAVYSLSAFKEDASPAIQVLPEMSLGSGDGASHDSDSASPGGVLEMQPDIEHSVSEQRSAT